MGGVEAFCESQGPPHELPEAVSAAIAAATAAAMAPFVAAIEPAAIEPAAIEPAAIEPSHPPPTAPAVGAASAVPAEVRSWAEVGLDGKVHVLHSTLDPQECRRARQLRTESYEVSVINSLRGEDGEPITTDRSRRAAYVAKGPALKALADKVRSRPSSRCLPSAALALTTFAVAGCTHDPSQVAGRLAKALGVREPPPLPMAARLRSMGGEAQALHTDFPEGRVGPNRRPGSIVINVSPTDARLHFLSADRRLLVQVTLRQGDGVHFLGDVIHCGSSYKEEHIRLHFFVWEEPAPGAPEDYELTFRDHSSFGCASDFVQVVYSGGGVC